MNKPLPTNKEVEEIVLAQLILEPQAFVKVADKLHSECFSEQSHSLIYDAISDLFARNKPIDMATIAEQLKKSGNLEKVGGAYQLASFVGRIASSAHIEAHVHLLTDLAIRRRLLTTAQNILKIGFDETIGLDEVVDSTSNLIDNAMSLVSNSTTIKDFSENLNTAIENIQESQNDNRDRSLMLIPPLVSMRPFVNEFMGGDLIIIAGRPGMGKTAFALFLAHSMAHQNQAVLFFSLEMQAAKLVNRYIQAETGLSKYDFERKLTPKEWELIDGVAAQRENIPMYIDDSPNITLAHIQAKSKIFKKNNAIRAVFIDYLQLMNIQQGKGQLREQAIAEVSRSLKSLARELNVPIFLLAQLNRGVESRPDKKPMLADLRESGAIEQDADIVIFPMRPEYYAPEIPEFRGTANIIFAKNRDGRVGEASVFVNETVSKFYDSEFEREADKGDPFTPIDRSF